MGIKEFVKKVLENRSNNQEKYDLGEISDDEAEKIKEETNVDVKGFKRVLESFGILHAFKHHGQEKKETDRGQIPITAEDFEKVPEITSNPDEIKKRRRKQAGYYFDKIYQENYSHICIY
jgi:hypothetical protein